MQVQAYDAEEREHRKYSPSQITRIALCPGSPRLVARAPVLPPPEYTIEGQNAHTVLQYALENRVATAKEAHRDYSHLCMDDLDTQENLFYFAIDVALDYVYAILAEYPDAVMYVENNVNVPSEVAPGEADGYCDIAIYIPSLRWLYIIDYKHGAGIAVDVKGNRQMRQYGAGFLYGEPQIIDPATVDNVTLVIVQPRAFHKDGMIRDHDYTAYELYEYLDEMDDIIRAAEADDAPLVPGVEQCRFCAAKTICPAREQRAIEPLRQVGIIAPPEAVRAQMLPDPRGMDAARLGEILLAAPALKKWLDDLEKHAYELLRSGHSIPHHKLVQVSAKREYYGDQEELAVQLAAILGKEPEALLRKKLLPITEMEKLLVQHYRQHAPKGEKNKASEQARKDFAFYTLKKSSGNLTMVTSDDERPAVNGATSAFKQIEGVVIDGN